MVSAAWGDFVVACVPMIRTEAARLVRGGAQIDADDAVQDVVASLLEDESETTAGSVRARIRSRLIDLVRSARAKKRSGREIDIERVPESGAFNGLPLTASCEDEVIEKVDAEKLLDLWPETRGGERAARRMRDRWLPAFQEFAKRGAA